MGLDFPDEPDEPEVWPADHVMGFPGEEVHCECDGCLSPVEKLKILAREYGLPWPGIEE